MPRVWLATRVARLRWSHPTRIARMRGSHATRLARHAGRSPARITRHASRSPARVARLGVSPASTASVCIDMEDADLIVMLQLIVDDPQAVLQHGHLPQDILLMML